MLAALALVMGCGMNRNDVGGQGTLVASFREPVPVRTPESYDGMVYDSREQRMLTYRIPKFARAESAKLYARGSSLRLKVTLKESLPNDPKGWVSVEAYFGVNSDTDDPPIFAYLAGPSPLVELPYLKPGSAIGVTTSGKSLGQISSDVKGRTVRFNIDASLVKDRELFAIVVRYMPESLARKSISGGFNATTSDVLSAEYMSSMRVPSLPRRMDGTQ